MSSSHPFLYDHLMDLLHKIDQRKYTMERDEGVLALLHFCADEGRVLLEADERVREMIQRRCREYHETASYYQEIAVEAARILLLLSPKPMEVSGVTGDASAFYDPTAHHC